MLTDRECQVLRLIAEGGQDAEIAERLGWQPWIIATDVRAILRKLGARNRAHAVRLGWEQGEIGREQT
jgi:DNA-binding CsgD family transcriptional regulator